MTAASYLPSRQSSGEVEIRILNALDCHDTEEEILQTNKPTHIWINLSHTFSDDIYLKLSNPAESLLRTFSRQFFQRSVRWSARGPSALPIKIKIRGVIIFMFETVKTF